MSVNTDWWSASKDGMEVQILEISSSEHPQCNICKETIKKGQYARFEYVGCSGDLDLDWAHISCIAATKRCPTCHGNGYVRDPNSPAPTFNNLLGIGGSATVTCPECDHKGYVPVSLVKGAVIVNDTSPRHGNGTNTETRKTIGKLESNSAYGRSARIGGSYP